MKNIKYKFDFRIVSILLIISFLFLSCNSSEKNKLDKESVSKQKVDQIEKKSTISKFEIVENEKVCMVNDRYMVVKQIPIEADGITYFGCCENCVKKLQENIAGVRYAKDPITGKEVDKANAVIVQNKENGVVFYFESKTSAEKFITTNS